MSEVAVIRQSACGENCASCGGCALSERIITAENTIGAKIGDKVVLEVPDRILLSGTGLLYLFPVILLLVSVIICNVNNFSEGSATVISLLVFGAALLLSVIFANIYKNHFKVKITEILNRK